MYLDLHVSTYLDNIGIEKFWKIESLKLKKSIRSRFGMRNNFFKIGPNNLVCNWMACKRTD